MGVRLHRRAVPDRTGVARRRTPEGLPFRCRVESADRNWLSLFAVIDTIQAFAVPRRVSRAHVRFVRNRRSHSETCAEAAASGSVRDVEGVRSPAQDLRTCLGDENVFAAAQAVLTRLEQDD